MIPFDGQFAQNYVYPFAYGAYNAENPPPGYTKDTDAFEILADLSPAFQARFAKMDPRHRQPYDAMLAHPRRPRITDASQATSAAVNAMPRSPLPNQHFGWISLDPTNGRLVVSFRGTEYFQDWLDDFDFAPAPYSPIPGRGTVHQGFLFVYEAVRESLRATLTNSFRPKPPPSRRFSSPATVSVARSPLSRPPISSTTSPSISRPPFTPGPSLSSAIPITSASSTPASTSATASSISGTSSLISLQSSPSTNTKAPGCTLTAASPQTSSTTTPWSPATPPASPPGT